MNNRETDAIDLLGYISSNTINVDDVKIRLQNFFSSKTIRITPDVIKELLDIIEEIVDDTNHNNLKEFMYYLNKTYNLTFIREQTSEIVLFDEETTDLNDV